MNLFGNKASQAPAAPVDPAGTDVPDFPTATNQPSSDLSDPTSVPAEPTSVKLSLNNGESTTTASGVDANLLDQPSEPPLPDTTPRVSLPDNSTEPVEEPPAPKPIRPFEVDSDVQEEPAETKDTETEPAAAVPEEPESLLFSKPAESLNPEYNFEENVEEAPELAPASDLVADDPESAVQDFLDSQQNTLEKGKRAVVAIDQIITELQSEIKDLDSEIDSREGQKKAKRSKIRAYEVQRAQILAISGHDEPKETTEKNLTQHHHK